MDVLIYFAILIGLIGIMAGWVYLKNKFYIKAEDLQFANTIIGLVVYLTNKGNVKISKDIKLVAKYVQDAISYVSMIQDDMTMDERKALIQDHALAICEENGINIDTELSQLVSDVVDYFI